MKMQDGKPLYDPHAGARRDFNKPPSRPDKRPDNLQDKRQGPRPRVEMQNEERRRKQNEHIQAPQRLDDMYQRGAKMPAKQQSDDYAENGYNRIDRDERKRQAEYRLRQKRQKYVQPFRPKDRGYN